MKSALLSLILLATPGLVWGDTIELISPKVSINGKVTFQGDSFRIELEGGKSIWIDSSQVRQMWFNSERASKKAPAISGPIKRGGLEPPQWRVVLKSGASRSGILEKIDDDTVSISVGGEKAPIKRADVETITLLVK